MSLLLEALKKAERAKEEAQRRSRGEGEVQMAGGQESPATAADKPAIVTRAELPDIRQPLEIVSDDLAPKQAQSPEKPATASPSPHADAAVRPQPATRASAQRVFEAKFREPNPRTPFYITLAVLGLFAVGTVIYFWYQLRPPPALVNANPSRSAEPTQSVAQAMPTALTAAPVAPAAIPGLPPVQSVTAQTVTPTEPPRIEPKAPPPAKSLAAKPNSSEESAPRAPSRRTPTRTARSLAPSGVTTTATAAATSSRAASSPTVSSRQSSASVNPKVAAGYAAYISGDLAAAHTAYEQALLDDGANRDALLGLAATDVRTGRFESAEATYLRLLQLDPNDPDAQSGLIALRSARLDPLATESRLKNMLAANPDASSLHFALGNQLARQGRWAEAQQEYFKAFAADPANADFAYNLAVSLDHLRQPKPALEYYRRALSLAERRAASFDITAARARVSQIEQP